MTIRTEKVNDLVRDNLSRIFQRELLIKEGVLISIAKVKTTPDLKNTRVYLSVFPAKEKSYVEKTIEYENSQLQKKLNQTLKMKILPKLEFIVDDKQEKISEIEKVFEQIKKEKEEQ
jgi:ribosome-binding factor A